MPAWLASLPAILRRRNNPVLGCGIVLTERKGRTILKVFRLTRSCFPAPPDRQPSWKIPPSPRRFFSFTGSLLHANAFLLLSPPTRLDRGHGSVVKPAGQYVPNSMMLILAIIVNIKIHATPSTCIETPFLFIRSWIIDYPCMDKCCSVDGVLFFRFWSRCCGSCEFSAFAIFC